MVVTNYGLQLHQVHLQAVFSSTRLKLSIVTNDLHNPILEWFNWNLILEILQVADQCMRWDVAERPSFSLLLVALMNFVRFRPSQLNRFPWSSLSFFIFCSLDNMQQQVQFSRATIHSRHLQVLGKGEPSRNAASWWTTASKEGRAWAVGWQDRGRKEGSGERRRNGKGMSSLFSSVSLASFQAFLSGRFSTSSAPVPTDGPRMVRLETGKSWVLRLSEALPLNGWWLPRRRVAPGGRRPRWAVSWWRGWPTSWCACLSALLVCGLMVI